MIRVYYIIDKVEGQPVCQLCVPTSRRDSVMKLAHDSDFGRVLVPESVCDMVLPSSSIDLLLLYYRYCITVFCVVDLCIIVMYVLLSYYCAWDFTAFRNRYVGVVSRSNG